MIKRDYLPFTILSYQKYIQYMLIFTSSLRITIILFMNSHPQLYNQGSIKFKLCIKHFHNTQKNQKSDQKSTNKQKNTSSKVSSKFPVKKCEKKCKRHAFSMVRRQLNAQQSEFRSWRYNVRHRFCYSFNSLLNKYEGGIPTFNHDNRHETPAFSLKVEQMLNAKDTVYEQRFKDALQKRSFQGKSSVNWLTGHDIDANWCTMVKQLHDILTRKSELQLDDII